MDDFSGFKELIPAENADHLAVVKALLNWFARFGVAHIHVSDRGSHFKNKVMEELAEQDQDLKTSHRDRSLHDRTQCFLSAPDQQVQ